MRFLRQPLAGIDGAVEMIKGVDVTDFPDLPPEVNYILLAAAAVRVISAVARCVRMGRDGIRWIRERRHAHAGTATPRSADTNLAEQETDPAPAAVGSGTR